MIGCLPNAPAGELRSATSKPVEMIIYGAEESLTSVSMGTRYLPGESLASLTEWDSVAGPRTAAYDAVPGLGQLKCFLLVRLSVEDGVYLAECEALEAVESGSSEDEALANLWEFVVHDYAHWQTTPDAELTPHAIELKRRFAALIG